MIHPKKINELTKSEILLGLRDGFPIFLGYQAYGIAYGILAKQVGLSVAQTLLMSFIVYAGTSQLIAIAMIAGGQGILSIVTATFIVNLRYFLMNGALSQSLRNWRPLPKFCLSYYVSDETFVVLSNHAETKDLTVPYAFSVNTISVFGWLLSSIIGFTAGNYIPDLKKFGFDYALIAVLIALSTLMTKSLKLFVIGVVAAGISTVLYKLGLKDLNILFAAIVAAMIGLVHSKRRYGTK